MPPKGSRATTRTSPIVARTTKRLKGASKRRGRTIARPPSSAATVRRLTAGLAITAARRVPPRVGTSARKAGAEPEPHPDRVEDRPLGHRRHPPAHLGVDADPDRPQDDRPEQVVAEERSRLGVEDEVADVEEAADRGDDAEGDFEDRLHGSSP